MRKILYKLKHGTLSKCHIQFRGKTTSAQILSSYRCQGLGTPVQKHTINQHKHLLADNEYGAIFF